MAKRRATKRTEATIRYPSHLFSPEDLLSFIELRAFSKRWDDLGLTDKEMSLLQALIMIDPTSSPIIEGTGGLRKMRCGRGNKGKSDGFRVCYVYYEEFKIVLMVIIYAKNEQDNIPDAQKPAIRKIIERIHRELDRRPKQIGPRRSQKETE